MTDPVDPSAGLPKNAPADLRAFLNCTGASVTFKSGKLDWLSTQNLFPGNDWLPNEAPSISIEAGADGSSANVSVKAGGLPLVTMPLSIANGQISVDTSGMLPVIGDPIASGINNLNAWFKGHGKGFGSPTFGKGGQVTLKKTDLPAPMAVPPPPNPPTGATPPQQPPKTVKISTGAVSAASVAELFNVPSTDPPGTSGSTGGASGTGSPGPAGGPSSAGSGGGSAGSPGGSGGTTTPQSQTIRGDSVGSVRTGTPSGSYVPRNQPAAGPESGEVPINEANAPEATPDDTTSAASSRAPAVASIVGVVLVLVLGLAGAMAFVGRPVSLSLPGESPSPTPSRPPGAGFATPAPSTPETSPSPIATAPPPLTVVIISGNEISFGTGLVDPAKLCRDGGTVTFLIRLSGIPPRTPVVLEVLGPGLAESTTFTADPDVNEKPAFPFPPGGGSFSDRIVSIGGQAPSSPSVVGLTAVSASTVLQCS